MDSFTLERTDATLDFATNNPINQLGPVIQQNIPVVTSNDFRSFMAAFAKRCNFVQEDEGDDIGDSEYKEACSVIDALPDSFPSWDENEVDRDRWMEKFDAAKRRDMTAAMANWADSTPRHLATKDLSVKQEVLMKRNDPTWAPRVIYAGNDEFNTITGPAAMIAMERLVQLTANPRDQANGYAATFGPVECMFAYKKNDVELARFISDPELPEHVEGDFSRNDREQRRRVAHLYDRFLQKIAMPQWYRTLLMQLEEFTVRSRRFGLRAVLKYQLPTGTTSTTPRNSFYNAVMFAVACKRQKITRAKALILGDDILAAMRHRLRLDAWTKTVANFKMVLKGKSPKLNGEATFLSRRFVTDHEHPFMLPLLGKMLVRFNVRGTHNEACTDSQYMAGKALSYAFECRHVPMLRDIFLSRYYHEDHEGVLFQHLSFNARALNNSVHELVRRITATSVTIDEDTFGYWCCEHYDTDLEEIRDLFTSVVLRDDAAVLDLPIMHRFECDW